MTAKHFKLLPLNLTSMRLPGFFPESPTWVTQGEKKKNAFTVSATFKLTNSAVQTCGYKPFETRKGFVNTLFRESDRPRVKVFMHQHIWKHARHRSIYSLWHGEPRNSRETPLRSARLTYKIGTITYFFNNWGIEDLSSGSKDWHIVSWGLEYF